MLRDVSPHAACVVTHGDFLIGTSACVPVCRDALALLALPLLMPTPALAAFGVDPRQALRDSSARKKQLKEAAKKMREKVGPDPVEGSDMLTQPIPVPMRVTLLMHEPIEPREFPRRPSKIAATVCQRSLAPQT